MLTLKTGTLTIRTGRLTADLAIGPDAAVRNDAEIYTFTTTSGGTITGRGTWWAHVTSKPIGGDIDKYLTVIYYGEQFVRRRFLQLMSGSFTVTEPTGYGDTE